MRKKILSIALILALCMSLSPMEVFAAQTTSSSTAVSVSDEEYGRAVQLGTGNISDPAEKYAKSEAGNYIDGNSEVIVDTSFTDQRYFVPSDYIYMGIYDGEPIKWRVLDADKANDGSTDGIFLLSENALYTSQDDYIIFKEDSNGAADANQWQGSYAQSWCTSFAKNSSVFYSYEQSAMFGVDKDDDVFIGFQRKAGQSKLTSSEKLFFLSMEEFANYVASWSKLPGTIAYGTDGNKKPYWLRSPSQVDNTKSIMVGAEGGGILKKSVNDKYSVRPATNISKSDILYIASDDTQDDLGLYQVSSASAPEWRVVFRDSSRSFKLNTSSVSAAAGESVSFSYTGAKTGDNEYISVMLMDGDEAEFYGRIKTSASASGTVSFAVPNLPTGTYDVKIFNEQYNGKKRSGTASAFAQAKLTVTGSVIGYAPGRDGIGRRIAVGRTDNSPVKLKGAVYTRPLFTQVGWSTTDGGAKEYELGDTYTAEGSITLYPVWKRSGGTVSYDLNGGKQQVVSIGSNTYVQTSDYATSYTYGKEMALPVPVHDEYTFNGWDGTIGDNPYGGIYSIPADAEGDAQLKASWRASDEWKISLSLSGGTLTESSQAAGIPSKYTDGKETTLPTLYKSGTTFFGWSGTIGEKTYEYIRAIPAGASGRAILTAQFGNALIHYYPGTYATGESITELNHDSYKLRSNTYSRDGYVQVGWSLTDGGEKQYKLGELYTSGNNLTLYPVWAKLYDLTYSYGEEKITVEKQEGVSITLKGETFKKACKRQDGWTTTENGEKEYELGAEFTLNANTTLYPTWRTAEAYDIIYDLDGGEFKTENPAQTYLYYENPELPTCKKTGFAFLGWSGTIGTGEYTKITEIPAEAEGNAKLKAEWKRATYGIRYQLEEDAKISSEDYPKQYVFGSENVELPVATRFGYRFTGWSGTIGDTEYSQITKIPTDAHGQATLKAEWESGFVVTYAPDNGTEGSAVKDTKFKGESLTLRDVQFTRSGYMQVGWTTSDGGEKVYDLGEVYMQDADITLYPAWAEGYTVTYLPGEGVSGEKRLQTVTAGKNAVLSDTVFSKSGLKQIGWTTTERGDKVYDLGEVYTQAADITLYPAWDKKFYDITYELNGGEIKDVSYAVEYISGVETELPKNVTLSGYTFVGWYDCSDSAKKKEKIEKTDSGDKTLYAIWESNYKYPYTVNIDSSIQNGTIVANPTKARNGITINLLAIPNEGYRFKSTSWAFSEDVPEKNQIHKFDDTAYFTMPAKDVTVKGTFTKINYYTVTFDGNGGVGTMESQTYPDGQYVTLPQNSFTREGYTFIGWNKRADGEYLGYADGAKFYNNSTKDFTLYAQWIEKNKDSDFYLSNLSAANIDKNSAKLTFNAGKEGTYYYILKKSGENAPESISDFASGKITSRKTYVWTKKTGTVSGTMTEGSNSISLTELDEDTAYTLYLAAVGENKDVTTGDNVLSCSFTTATDKLSVDISELPVLSGIYGQQVAQMSFTGGKVSYNGSEISGTWKVTDTNKSDIPTVGTSEAYEVTFTPDDSAYRSPKAELTPIVAKRKITVKADNKEKAYGESNPELTFTISAGAAASGDTKADLGITLSCAADENSPFKTGGYAISGASNSTNYDVTIIPGVLTVNKANAVISGTEVYTKNYGDAAFALDAASNHNESELTYTVVESKDSSGAVTTNDKIVSVDKNGNVTIKAAGSAKIRVSLAEGTNYNAAADKTVSIIVNKKTGYTAEDINKTYVYNKNSDDRLDLSKYVASDCGKVSFGVPQIGGAVTYTSEPAISENGILSYTVAAGTKESRGSITVKLTSDNYADYTITVNVKLIEQNAIKLCKGSSVTLKKDSLTYGEALSKLEFNAVSFEDNDGNKVAGVLSWKEPNAVPNAGTEAAAWIFKPNDISYADAEGSIEIKVNKASLTVSEVPAVASITYHPDNILTNDMLTGGVVKGINGSVISGAWSWLASNIVPTASNNGYEAVFTPAAQADRDNYEYGSIKENIAVSVEKKAVTVKADDKEKIYGEENPEFTVTLPEGALTGSEKLSDLGIRLSCEASRTSPVKAGGYTISGASDNANYAITVTPGVLTVKKANQSVTAEAVSGTYGDTDKLVIANGIGTLTYEVATGTDVVDVDSATGKLSFKKSGTATVKVSAAGDSNHEQGATSVTVTVGKKALTIKAKDKKLLLNSQAPDLSSPVLGTDYEIVGILEGDELSSSVTVTLSCVPDMSSTGDYEIALTVSGTDERYEIVTENGSLNVYQKSSGGGVIMPTVPKDDEAKTDEKTDTDTEATDQAQTESIARVKELIGKLMLTARSEKTAKKSIKVRLKADNESTEAIKEVEKLGYTVKYKYYRSTKKSSGYKAMLTKTSKTYVNTSGVKGKKYYYKARVQVYDKDGKLVAQTALKQCRFAYRTWTK